jgi:ankyrin repeat protein
MPASVSKLEQTIDRLSGSERWAKGNADTVHALSEDGFDFKSQPASEILVNVARLGSAEAIRDLITAGVVVQSLPIHTAFGEEDTALGNAAMRGNVEMLRVLAGASLYDPTALTEALKRAAWSGKLDAMSFLIQHGANPTAPGVLVSAANSGVPDVVHEILKYKPDVNTRGQGNATALISCFQANPYRTQGVDVKEVVRMLLLSGADPRLPNDKGETPLMLNARELEIAHMLVAHGADVNARAKDGFTPLLNAETVELTRFLLEHGADPFAKSDQGETALDWAKKMNRTDQAALLEAAMTSKNR